MKRMMHVRKISAALLLITCLQAGAQQSSQQNLNKLHSSTTGGTDSARQATLELVTLTGTSVYHLHAGTIPQGVYAIPLQVGYLAPATYLLVIKYNGHTESIKYYNSNPTLL